jgi:hypothetical protein
LPGVVLNFGHEVLHFLSDINLGFILKQIDCFFLIFLSLSTELNLGPFFFFSQQLHLLQLRLHGVVGISFKIKLKLITNIRVDFLDQVNTSLFTELNLEALIGKENGLADRNVVDGDDIDYPADTAADICV